MTRTASAILIESGRWRWHSGPPTPGMLGSRPPYRTSAMSSWKECGASPVIRFSLALAMLVRLTYAKNSSNSSLSSPSEASRGYASSSRVARL